MSFVYNLAKCRSGCECWKSGWGWGPERGDESSSPLGATGCQSVTTFRSSETVTRLHAMESDGSEWRRGSQGNNTETRKEGGVTHTSPPPQPHFYI